MEESRMQILIAVTIFLIGLFFIIGEILSLAGMDIRTRIAAETWLSVLVFVFATATAIILLSDAMKMPEKD